MKRTLTACFLFFCSAYSNYAQLYIEPVFQHLPAEKLGVGRVYHQFWDKQGGMWMASDKGILYYNGYHTKLFQHIPGDTNSILENTVLTFYLDKRGECWMGYANSPGITRFNPATGKFTHYHPDSTQQQSSIPAVAIVNFVEDSKGRFWVLTWGGGLVKLNRDNGRIKVYKRQSGEKRNENEPNGNQIKAMVEMKDGRFLMGYFSEGYGSPPSYFDAEKEMFTLFDLEPYIKNAPKEDQQHIASYCNITHFIHVDHNDNLWFGTYSGLVFINVHEKYAQRVSGTSKNKGNLDNTRSCIVDDNGLLWIGTPNNGILVVDADTREATYIKHNPKVFSSISDNRISTMRKDVDGNIWISTGTGGFSIYSPLVQQFNMYPWTDMELEYSNRSAQSVPVNQMLVSPNGNVYLSSEVGMIQYDIKHRKTLERLDPRGQLNHGSNDYIASRITSFKFFDNNLLMIAPTIPAVYNLKTKQYKRVQPQIPSDGLILFRHNPDVKRALVRMGYGFATTSLYEYDFTTGSFTEKTKFPHGLWVHEHFAIVLRSGKWLLAAGERAFLIMNPDDLSYEVYGPDSGRHHFPDSTILSGYMDAQGQVWIGTQNGLYRFDEKTGKSTLMNQQVGINNEPVNAMIADRKGIFWLALHKELVRWDPVHQTMYRFGNEMGMRSGTFLPSVAQNDASGKIYIATINGILVFDPNRVVIPQTKPRLFIHSLYIREDTLSAERLSEFTRGNMELGWDENFLNLEVYTNQIFAPSAHHFYYRLAGLDSAWQDNGTSHRFRFTNLSHGQYTLEIKMVNAYNVTSEILRIPFVIQRPFWLSWWFYVLLAMGLIGAVYVYIRIRERNHRKQQEILEAKIEERTAEVVAKAREIELQKNIIEEKNTELTDSIHYAQRIQQSILPDENTISKNLPEHFIFFKPKDIVSGDFYWFTKQKDSILWAVVDCTGHGVPGGFMSMLGSGLLNQIVNEELKLQPDVILNHLRDRVMMALKQTGGDGESRDGMDISLCRYIFSENKLEFAGANNSLYLVRNNELKEIRADKQPIGIYIGDKKPFNRHEVALQKGDLLYMASDGYADQFGGEKGKKFKSSSFEKLLMHIHSYAMKEQLDSIESTFVSWKGDYEQLDDVCVVGVRL